MRLPTFAIFLFALFWRALAAPIPDAHDDTLKRALPEVAPSMPNPNSGIFERSLVRVIQSQTKSQNQEFFENVHDGLLRAWRAQAEVRRYWEVVEEIKQEQAIEVGGDMRKRAPAPVPKLDIWPQTERFQWRTNCEWLLNVSRRLTAVYKLPVPALSIFPNATPQYCAIK